MRKTKEIKPLADWEIMLNQAEVDIAELRKDAEAGLYPFDKLDEFITKSIGIGKKIGKAELLGKQWKEAETEQRTNEELETEAEAQKHQAIII